MGCYWKGGVDLQATINGCQIHYEIRHNPGQGAPTIVLLHGWGCDSSTFSFIADALAERAMVVTLDFPGHGQSGEPPVPWGVSDYAEQVYALLQANGCTRIKLVAHSFGGRVALMLAVRYPQLIDQLVITGGAGIKKPVSERSRKRAAQFKRYSAILERVKHVPPLASMAERLQARLRTRYVRRIMSSSTKICAKPL